MHKRNGVQLRLALSATAVCAVLAAATFSGDHRAGSLAITMAREPDTILVRSVSTIRKPSVERARTSHEHFATPSKEALLHLAKDLHKGE
jgi:hypothetical protein